MTTTNQLSAEKALDACRALRAAYLSGSERGGSMEWSDVDDAMAIAAQALKANGEDYHTEGNEEDGE